MRLFVTLSLCVGSIVGAQSPAAISWGFGVAAGQMKFDDTSRESAIGATISARAWNWVDFSVNPTYAWMQSAPVSTTGTTQLQSRNVSGIADLPITVGLSHSIVGPWSPSFGVSLGFTLPVGDTAKVGSGATGVGANVDLGFSPSDKFSFDIDAGRSLAEGYGAGLASSSPTALSLSTMFQAGVIGFGLSIASDVGAVPVGTTRSQTVAAGVAVPMGERLSLTFDASTGLSAGSHSWAYSVGLGTTPSGIVAASIAPYQRLRRAFGIGNKQKTKKTKP